MKKLLFLLTIVLSSCTFNSNYFPERIEGRQLNISDSIPENDSITAFIQPYKENIDREMNMVLAYMPWDMTKNDGELNTAIGNMMADAVMELSNPIFEKRTGNTIDMVLLNHGGIRSSVSKGNLTTRTAYEIMPFENEVVVAKMKGKHVREMINFLIDAGQAHPVAGLQLQIADDNSVRKMLIQNEALDDEKLYFIATHDYLVQGGDNMVFFSHAQEVIPLNYKIRNILIDYFKTNDTIAPVRDERFIRVN